MQVAASAPVVDDFKRPSTGTDTEAPAVAAGSPSPSLTPAMATVSTESGRSSRSVSHRRVRRPLVLLSLVAVVAGVAALVAAGSGGHRDPQRAAPATGTATPTSQGGAIPPKSQAPVATTAVPLSEVDALVDGALTPEGKRLFASTRPEILDRAAFAVACPTPEEAAIVLGCYSDGRIFVLRVGRADLSRVMQSTAAHELLHAGYEALPVGERVRIDQELDAYYRTLNDPELRDLLSIYDRSEPLERDNELHSILPTTLRSLSPSLENYYGRYFTSRSTVVDAYESYKAPFKALREQVDGLHREITDLSGRLGRSQQDIDARKGTLQALQDRLVALDGAGDIRSYNALIPEQNAQADQIDALIDQFNATVAVHNANVAEVDALVLQERELENSVGSYPK